MNDNNLPKLNVEFLGCSKDPIEVIYSAFRVCYSRDNAMEIWQGIKNGRISRKTMNDFVAEKLGTGHTRALRQVQFVFVIDNVSRACTAQFNRHPMGVEGDEMSLGCVNFSDGINSFATPPSIQKNRHVFERWIDLQNAIGDFYSYCIEQGVQQEDARFVLPMGTVSREQFSMDFQALQQFLDLRMCESAQWEIRDMSWQIYRIMAKEFPTLATRLGSKCWENRSLYCDEDYKTYEACKWSEVRPHKSDLAALWKNHPKSA